MTIDANGNVVINEYKSSLTAPLTSNQKIVFPEIFESGATIVGKGKGIFSGGYQSGSKTITKPYTNSRPSFRKGVVETSYEKSTIN